MIDLFAYVPKTVPYAHQVEAFRRSADAPIFGLLLEMRLGKSKVALDTVAYQYLKGAIDSLLIVAAPNGIHRSWVSDEIPAHLPDNIPRQCLIWRSGLHKRAYYAKEMDLLLKYHDGLAVLAVNAEALTTPALREYLKRFLAGRKVFVVNDETSHWARSAGATRTKIAIAVSKHPSVKFKRILDGTPVGEDPLDLYSQVALLSHSIFGFTSYTAFKNYFAVWESGRNHNTGTDYPVLKEYRNLDELKSKLASVSYRATRAECWDLPPKIYQKMYFQLSSEQRKAYNQLREEYEVELSAESTITVQHVLTRYLRLQQITSNYWPRRDVAVLCRDCSGEGCAECDYLSVRVITESEHKISDDDPRLEALKNVLSQPNAGPFIVWCRFHHDVDAVMAEAAKMRLRPVQFDGRINDVEKHANLEDFQAGRSNLLVGTPGSGGRGRRMSAVRTIAYFSSDYSLLNRQQSEDRGEYAERKDSVSIIDLLAEDTIDEEIVTAHLTKRRLVDMILEKKDKWLR